MLHDIITDTTARARSLACPELALGATRRPVLTAVSNQMGADVRAMTRATAGRWRLGRSGTRRADARHLAEGVIFYAIAGAGTTCVPAVPDLCRHAGRLLASLGVAGDGFVARPERHCAAVVVPAGAPAVMR